MREFCFSYRVDTGWPNSETMKNMRKKAEGKAPLLSLLISKALSGLYLFIYNIESHSLTKTVHH